MPSPVEERVMTVEDTSHPIPSPSLATTSTARLSAQIAGAVFGSASSVVTARTLGPSGKGVLSTLVLIAHELLFYAAAFGLGDAAIILQGRGESSAQRAVGATLPLLVLSSMIGGALTVAVAGIVLREEWPVVAAPLAVVVILLPVWVFFDFLIHVLNSQEDIVHTSMVILASTAASTLGVVVALPVLHSGITGAVIGAGVGPAVAVAICFNRARRYVVLRPRVDLGYLRRGLTLGAPIAGSYLLVTLSQRLDQLLVFTMSGKVAAGEYSVALTIGLVTTHAPVALSLASFPRLARMDGADAHELIARVCRIGVAAAGIASIVLALASPFAVPLLFGPGFRASVVPTLILLAGSVFWSSQWLLARARAARGTTRPLFASFSTSLAAIVLSDLLLIPILGTVGAALGAVIGGIAGSAVALSGIVRSDGYALSELLPGPADVRSLVAETTDLARKARRRLLLLVARRNRP